MRLCFLGTSDAIGVYFYIFLAVCFVLALVGATVAACLSNEMVKKINEDYLSRH